MSAELVSVVIPVFNGARFLADACETVFGQTHPRCEVIVVDDGSTDDTAAVAARYADRVRYLRQENAGSSSARNRGIGLASGEFIALLDCDDLWERDKTTRQLERFRARPTLGILTAHMRNQWTDEVKGERERLEGSRVLDVQPNVGSSLLARRSVFQRFGALDAKMKHRDVQDWIARVTAQGVEAATMPDVLVTRRIHQNNASRTRGPEGTLELLEMARARLARRKDGG